MSTSVVKWSEDLSISVSNIIRRYIDYMRTATNMAVSFITSFRFLLVLFCISLYTVVCF